MKNLIIRNLFYKNLKANGAKWGEAKFIIDANNRKTLQLIAAYIEDCYERGDITKGIFLRGDYGVGKTVIMRAVFDTLSEVMHKTGRVIGAKSLVGIKGEYITHEGKEISVYDGILCIDDLGVEPETIYDYGTKRMPIADIIDERYIRGRPTFATSNSTPDEIKKQYGERITERLREMCIDIVITGPSRRKATS